MFGFIMYVYIYKHTLTLFLQKIHLSASVGSTVKQQLPLVNSGNISVHLKVQVGRLFPLEIMIFVLFLLY